MQVWLGGQACTNRASELALRSDERPAFVLSVGHFSRPLVWLNDQVSDGPYVEPRAIPFLGTSSIGMADKTGST